MKKVTYFINPATGEKVAASSKEDVKKYVACGWRRVKKAPQYDVRTGKRI